MISLKVSLDQRRLRKDETYPIIFRVTYRGKSRDLFSGFTCTTFQWDDNAGTVKATDEASLLTQQRLRSQWLTYQEKLLEYERKLLDPTKDIQDVKNYLSGKQNLSSTIHDLWQEEVMRLEATKRFGNARNYRSSYGGITKFTSLQIPVKKIDYGWLLRLESGLIERGVSTNSVAVYMRTLRAVYNKAINLGIADSADYPFRRYKIKETCTTPRVANLSELRNYFRFNPAKGTHLYDAWNYGRLIFMLRGINFADLAQLTHENIQHNRIIYQRAKTHKHYSVKLLPLASEIFKEYFDPERKTLLPILTNTELQNKKCIPDRIGQQRKNTNKWLRRIGTQVGINVSMSTYVFRYSHANMCRVLGYSKDIISESLGHAYGLAVTSCYLENYNVELIDEMNLKVCESVF